MSSRIESLLAFGLVVSACSVLFAAAAGPTRDWQQGTWRDADKIIRAVHTNLLSGTNIGGCVVSPDGDKALAFQTCVIETADSLYFVRKRLNFRGSDTVPMTVDMPARFALAADTIYVVGDDGKEYKLGLVATVRRSSSGP